MANVICVCLRKGGSGKTTTAVNLAAGLQRRDRRVLLIDLDDQSNATMCAGINPFAVDKSINSLLTDINVEPHEAIAHTEYGLDVIPATPDLERTAAGMNATSLRTLVPIIEELASEYDDIVIDTQPGHSYLSLSGLVASQWALIPLQAHYLALEGLARIMGDIDRVQHGDVSGSRRGYNADLRVLGIVPVMMQNTRISRAIVDKAREDYPGLVLPVEIRLAIKFVDASLEGVPLVVAYPNQLGAQEYMQLADLVLQKVEGEHGKE